MGELGQEMDSVQHRGEEEDGGGSKRAAGGARGLVKKGRDLEERLGNLLHDRRVVEKQDVVLKMKRFLEAKSRRKPAGWAEPGQAPASVEGEGPWSLRHP